MGKNANAKYYLNSVIVVAIMVFFRFLPTVGSMTPLGVTVLGIFIGALYGWIKCDMVWPSVLAMILLGMTDYVENVSAVFTSAISNFTIQMMIWLLVFSAILTVSGISKQLATRMIRSKFGKGHPWLLSIAIYAAAGIVAAFGGGFAAILICWDFTYNIAAQVGYTNKDKWPRMMVISVVVAVCIVACLLPFQVGIAATFGYLFTAAANAGVEGYTSYNFVTYLLLSSSMIIVSSSIFFVLLKFIIRPDVEKLKSYSDDTPNEPFTAQQKIAVWALVAMIVLTSVPSMLPACALKTVLTRIGTTPIILAITVVITYLRDKDGKQYFTFQQLGSQGMFWPMMFMVSTAVVVGGALSTPAMGFTSTIMSIFTPIFQNATPYVFGLVILAVTMLLTNMVNNAVAGAIMVPVMFSFAVSIGANPMAITACTVLASNMGILLPCASPSAAMLHSNKEWTSTKEIFQVAVLGLIAVLITIALVGLPLGNILFA